MFCRIAAGELPSDMVYSDAEIIAFRDINPQAAVHVLVVPRKHVPSLVEAEVDDESLLGRLARVAADIARQEGIASRGFRVVINNGVEAQQSVPHLHLHVLGGRHMAWPPG